MNQSSIDNVLIAPVMSEKAMQGEMQGKYTFFVAREATKIQVKQAVASIYGVLPVRVRMINTDGNNVRFGRFTGRRAATRKAVVTLPAGKQIAIHEGV